MIGKFFHTSGTRKFKIIPRFYDPEQEARDERERRIREDLGMADEKKDDGKFYPTNIKGQFRVQAGLSRSMEEARKSQNRRLILIILILALVLYLFFYSDFLG